ncbi:MAG: type IV pilus assembly protein PilM [Salinisphaeraceae bacterium]
MGLLDSITGRESPELVALDISADRVKLLELGGSLGTPLIKAFATEALPADAVQDRQIVEPELVAQSVNRAMQKSGCRQQQAAVAVSGSAVISKIIDMPATLTEDEIEQQIGFEADAYIPYPIEDVSLDFQIMGPSPHDSDMQQVLLAACRRDNVEMRIAAVEIAGLKVRLVDVESYALQNACGLLIEQMPDKGAERTVAVVDVGATTTAVNVLHSGETIYTREQAFGGSHLVEEIQRHEGLDSSEAALARLRSGELPADYLASIVPDFAEQLAQQIDRSLQLFFSQSGEIENVDQIILTGGCALFTGLDDHVGRTLEIATASGNPLAGLKASGGARRGRVDAEAPALMVATGLALRALG